MEEARATRALSLPRETLAVALPAAAEGLVQADRGLQADQSQLHGGILRRVQRALRFEDRQQGFRAGLVAAVGEIEGALRLLKLLLLPVQLAVEAVDAVQRAFGVGKGGEDRLAVGFQQFFLARQAAVALGAQAAVVEDRGEQVGAQVVIGVAGKCRRRGWRRTTARRSGSAGNSAARATCTSAWAAASYASALAISGRRLSSSLGRPAPVSGQYAAGDRTSCRQFARCCVPISPTPSTTDDPNFSVLCR